MIYSSKCNKMSFNPTYIVTEPSVIEQPSPNHLMHETFRAIKSSDVLLQTKYHVTSNEIRGAPLSLCAWTRCLRKLNTDILSYVFLMKCAHLLFLFFSRGRNITHSIAVNSILFCHNKAYWCILSYFNRGGLTKSTFIRIIYQIDRK